MKIVIVGAGVSGSWLTRLIQDRLNIEVFDPNPKRGCFCGWGSTRTLLDAKTRKVGLDPSDYALCKPNFNYTNGIGLKVTDAVMFNKRKMLRDLTEGVKISPKAVHCLTWNNGQRLLVNATGKPLSLEGCFVNYMVQWKMRLKAAETETTYAWLDPKQIGYGWAFPLDEEAKVFHVGAGTLDSYVESASLTNEVLKNYGLKVEKVYCGCWRPLYTGRHFPILEKSTVSIGEAAGCVHPLTGEGILPSIESAEFLAESLRKNDSFYSYVSKMHGLLTEYNKAFKALETWQNHRRLGWIRAFRVMSKRIKQRTKPLPSWKDKLDLLTKLLA